MLRHYQTAVIALQKHAVKVQVLPENGALATQLRAAQEVHGQQLALAVGQRQIEHLLAVLARVRWVIAI